MFFKSETDKMKTFILSLCLVAALVGHIDSLRHVIDKVIDRKGVRIMSIILLPSWLLPGCQELSILNLRGH